ncbi:hypothetical protein GCM10009789_39230 [Kribbella sancticallisti]|uniref:Uncharacterized protein n=1 Tax=Kribbella sancticallisti TaxID=460087 RepID=A0ABP4PHS7_9ACTN
MLDRPDDRAVVGTAYADTPRRRATGGVQKVAANNATDTTQIELIRGHLREEATKFSRGDFADRRPSTVMTCRYQRSCGRGRSRPSA